MSNKRLLVLFLITITVMIAAFISSQNRAPQTSLQQTLLFPQLKEKVNDLAAIEIKSGTDSLYFAKSEDNWLIRQADDYPADFDKLRQLVIGAAELVVISGKTSNPEYFAELGVEDPVTEGAQSHLLTLIDSSSNPVISLIVGRQSQTGTQGLYVRKPETSQTFLVRGSLDISTDIPDWIDKNLLDIANDRIMETRIEHPDGTTVTLMREAGEENFTLVEIPEGKQPKSDYFINQPASFLSQLTVDNVKSAEDFAFTDETIKTTIRTYDGLVATVSSGQVDWTNHIALSFSIDEETIDGENPEKIRDEVAELNARVANRIFVVPVSKYYLLDKKPDELLEDIASQ